VISLQTLRENQDCLTVWGSLCLLHYHPCKHSHVALELPTIVQNLQPHTLRWRITPA
jgi:hypothetical protein